MLGVDLEETKDSQYLGVFLQNDLRWNKQVNNKATKVPNFIKRNFHHTSFSTKYNSLVRPHLNYTTAAWDPYTSKNISQLEKVQNPAARLITNTYDKETVSVTALKEQLAGLASSKDVVKEGLITCTKSSTTMWTSTIPTEFIQPKTDRTRRGTHDRQFHLDHTRTEA